jgi:outer membrane protein TolC
MTALARFVLALVVIAAARPAFSQTPEALTLDEAIARAVERAPKVADARAREAAAEAFEASKTALKRPTLSATSAFLRTNHVEEFGVTQPGGGQRILFPDVPSNYRVRADLTVPLYSSGRIGDVIEAARADRRAAAADRRSAEHDIRLEVARAYWQLVLARQTEQVIGQAVARADAWVGDVKSRVDAGVLPPNDLLSAQAQRARQAVRLIQARNSAAVAELDLGRLIGVSPGTSITATSAVDRPASGAEAVIGPPNEIVGQALSARAERESLLERQGALLHTADATLAALRPQILALAAVEPARPNVRFAPRADEWRTSWDLGVTLTWPIFDGGRARADRAAAVAQARAIGERVQDFDALVGVEIRRRLLDLEAGKAALAASDEAVAAATEARRVIGERFRAGVATSTEVIDADLAQLEAEVERAGLHVSQRLTEAVLMRAVGGK